MSGSDGEIVFERVGPDPPEGRADADDAWPSDAPGPREDLETPEIEPLDRDRFPLAGPILESSTRKLKGRCSECEAKLRLEVKTEGPVKVRCPICGHTRRIHV